MHLFRSLFRFSSIKYIIFLLPFIQIIPALFFQISLVTAAPAGTQFHQAAWREYYVTIIRQGILGNWLTTIPYTTTPYPAAFGFNFFFIILGQIARVTNIDAVTILNITQLLMGVVLFCGTFWAFNKLLPKSLALLAYFFTTFLETGMYIPTISAGPTEWLPSFVMQQQLIERHFGLSHHTLAKTLGLFFMVFLFSLIKNPKSAKNILLVIITGFIGAFLLPPFFIVLFSCVLLPYACLLLIKKQLLHRIPIFIIASLAVLAPVVILKTSFASTPALSHYTEIEKTWWTNEDTLLRYASSLLLYYPWIGIGIVALLVKWRQTKSDVKMLLIFSLFWLIGPVLLIFLSSYSWFPLANGRLTDGYQYIPAGILSAFGCYMLLKHRLGKILAIIALTATILLSGFTTLSYVRNLLARKTIPYTNIYPTNSFWQAIAFLKTVPKGSGVIAHELVSEIIPSYADVYVYSAGPGLTYPEFGNRVSMMRHFYSGTMSEEEVKDFLKKNNIQYIYYGVDEMNMTQTATLYGNILVPAYVTDQSIILKLKE